MLTEYETRGEPQRDARYRLLIAIPGYPAGYVTDRRNKLLPRWLKMGIAERVEDELPPAPPARRRRGRRAHVD